MINLDLFTDTPRSRKTDPESSHAAADNVKTSGSLARQQNLVLAFIRLYPGSTAIELAHHMALSRARFCHDWHYYHDWTRRRLPELAPHLISRGAIRKCRITHRNVMTWFPHA